MKKEVDEFVGKRGTIVCNLSLTVEVKITDVRKIYGKTQYLVTPVAGKGERWVEDVEVIK